MEDIRKICNDNLNHIRTMVNLVINEHYKKEYGSEILRKRGICGASQEAIAIILLNKGIEVKKYSCPHKFSQTVYPYDHTFSVFDETIIDGGYFQAIDHFGLTKENMPKDEILIFHYKKLGEVIDNFMLLSQHSESLKSEHVKDLTDQELRNRFLELWDYKNNEIYMVEEQSFHQVIKKYAQNNLSR